MAIIRSIGDDGIVRRTWFVVMVAGTDISTRLKSRLLRLEVTDKSNEDLDTCSIELSDSGGALVLPRRGVAILVQLGTGAGELVTVFEGTVDDVRCTLDRGGGRRIKIDGKSADTRGKAKTPVRKHWDGKTYGDALKESAKAAGVSMTVHPSLAAKKPSSGYIAQDGESFLHFAQRIARELGATFKVIGPRAVMMPRNDGQSAGTGASLGTVTAAVGANLITADISPDLGRPALKKVKARWYDRKKAKHVEEEVEVEGAEVEGLGERLFSRAGKDDAKDSASGHAKESERDKGAGSVRILGEPRARAEMHCVVTGVRPGVDGTYVIDSVQHVFERSSGYETTLELKKPDGGAGKDSRKAS